MSPARGHDDDNEEKEHRRAFTRRFLVRYFELLEEYRGGGAYGLSGAQVESMKSVLPQWIRLLGNRGCGALDTFSGDDSPRDAGGASEAVVQALSRYPDGSIRLFDFLEGASGLSQALAGAAAPRVRGNTTPQERARQQQRAQDALAASEARAVVEWARRQPPLSAVVPLVEAFCHAAPAAYAALLWLVLLCCCHRGAGALGTLSGSDVAALCSSACESARAHWWAAGPPAAAVSLSAWQEGWAAAAERLGVPASGDVELALRLRAAAGQAFAECARLAAVAGGGGAGELHHAALVRGVPAAVVARVVDAFTAEVGEHFTGVAPANSGAEPPLLRIGTLDAFYTEHPMTVVKTEAAGGGGGGDKDASDIIASSGSDYAEEGGGGDVDSLVESLIGSSSSGSESELEGLGGSEETDFSLSDSFDMDDDSADDISDSDFYRAPAGPTEEKQPEAEEGEASAEAPTEAEVTEAEEVVQVKTTSAARAKPRPAATFVVADPPPPKRRRAASPSAASSDASERQVRKAVNARLRRCRSALQSGALCVRHVCADGSVPPGKRPRAETYLATATLDMDLASDLLQNRQSFPSL